MWKLYFEKNITITNVSCVVICTAPFRVQGRCKNALMLEFLSNLPKTLHPQGCGTFYATYIT